MFVDDAGFITLGKISIGQWDEVIQQLQIIVDDFSV